MLPKEREVMQLQAEQVKKDNNRRSTVDQHQIINKDLRTLTTPTTSLDLKMLSQSKERPIILN